MKGRAVVAMVSVTVLMASGCSVNATQKVKSTVGEDIQTETTAVQTEESTEAASGEATTNEYVLTEEARGELENVFMDCFYFNIGDHKEKLFSDLSLEEVEQIACTTFLSPDSYLSKGTYDEGTGYIVSRDDLAEYLKDGFGLDIDSYDFSSDQYGMLKDNGATLFFLGGDYGNGIPDAIINTIEQDPENGIVALTGDALFIDIDGEEINPYVFTATMKPSDSKYFGGCTLISFEYEENTTGVYPEINPEKYGLLPGHHFEIKVG